MKLFNRLLIRPLQIITLLGFMSPLAFSHYAVVRVKVDASVSSKHALISRYAATLDFPAYCGANWDGFEECLNDLSWFQRDEHVILEHKGMPILSATDLKIYLEIIRDAEIRSRKGNHPIEVVFQ